MQPGLKRFLTLLLTFVTMFSLHAATEARGLNKYAHWGFGKPYGYKDKTISPSRWEIEGLGTNAQPGYMVALVLRRAAVLAKAGGYDYFYVVGVGLSCSGSPFVLSTGKTGPGACDYVLSQSALLIAVGIPSLDTQVPCEGRAKEACRSYSVSDVIRTTNSFFGLTDEQFQQELAIEQNRKRNSH